MKKTFIAITLFILINTHAFAACTGVSCVDVKITRINPTDGHTYILTSGTEANLSNCVPIGGTYLKLLNSHSSVDRIYSLLLSAKLNDLDVTIRTIDTAGNTGDCLVSYATLN